MEDSIYYKKIHPPPPPPLDKKRVLKWILIAAGVLLVAAFLGYAYFIGGFKTYDDRTYGFRIDYPKDWEKVVAPEKGAAVVFLSKRENALDLFSENVNIAVQPVPPQVATLSGYTQKVLQQMKAVFANVEVKESKAIDIGDRKGWRALFVAEKPDKIKVLVVWTIKDGTTAYTMTYFALGNKYEKYLPLVEQMIRTFRVWR